MDKYEGIYRVEVNLTDNSDYSHLNEQNNRLPREGESRIPHEQNNRLPREDESRIPNEQSSRLSKEYESRFPDEQNNRLPTEYESRLPREYDYYAKEPQYQDTNMVEAGNLPLYQVGENNLYYGDKALVYRRARKKSGNFKGFCIRVLVSAVLFLGVYGVSKLDTPFANQVNDTIKKAVTYDLDPSKDKELGEIKVVKQIKDEIEKAKEEE